MKISVIVPYKDAAPWLVRCLNSLTDNEGDFEFILVNDNSSDAGPSIVEDYSKIDERFIVLDNEHAPGVSGARNTGIDWARGDYITFLDADDKLFEDVYKVFATQTHLANVIQFNHLRYYSKNNRTRLKYANPPGQYNTKRLPLGWCYIWNKLFNREFIGDEIRFREGFQYGEDELFSLECLAKENLIYCVEPITVVHCFDNMESLSRLKTETDLLEQVHVLETFLLSQSDPEIRDAVCLLISRHWQSDLVSCANRTAPRSRSRSLSTDSTTYW